MATSQVFPVKSNAIRAAVRMLKVTREQAHKLLIAVSGGYQFEITEGKVVFPASPDIAETEEHDLTDDELLAARAEHTIVNGEKTVVVEPPAAPIESPAVASAKAPRKRKAKAPKAVKPVKVPKAVKAKKPTKAPKAKRPVTNGKRTATVRGTPAYDKVMAARRTSQGRRGVIDDTVRMLREDWVTAGEIMRINEWQPSTMRGLLSLEKKKLGFTLHRRKDDNGENEYHITGGKKSAA